MPTVYIQNPNTGLVLDIKDNNAEKGGEVVMFTYHGGKNQLWKHKDGMFYSKLNKDLVLDFDQVNQRIITWPAHGGSNQKWIVNDDGTITTETGHALDVADNCTDAGAKVIAFGKNGGANQLFNVVKK